jgi:Taurine catabolism dioxygenase TauD, TfdA family
VVIINLDDRSISTETIALYKQIIDRVGWILLTNLPPNFEGLNFSKQFGRLMPQYDGQLSWDVKTNNSIINSHCSLGSLEVTPHTEFYEGVSDPPNYLALWCLNPSSCGGGKISIGDSYPFLEALPKNEYDCLYKNKYIYKSEKGLIELGLGQSNYHPILSNSLFGKKVFRFNLAGMEEGDPIFLASFRQKFMSYYQENQIDFLQPKNSLLIWDNFRMIHSRSTRFQDPKRHLIRFWFAENA